jgi:hypothetical protein
LTNSIPQKFQHYFSLHRVQDIIEEESIEFIGAIVYIAHNTISKMGSNWLKAVDLNNITVMNNTFGTFNSMILDGSPNMTCLFYHNKFTTVEEDSFKRISTKCPYKQLIFYDKCDCNFPQWLQERFEKSMSLKDLESESFCTLRSNDELLKCLNGETIKFEHYYDEKCGNTSKGKRFNCKKVKVEKIDAKFVDPKILSDEIDWMEYVNIYTIICFALILILPCFVCIIFNNRQPRRDENYNTSNNFHNNHHQTDLLHLNQSEGPPSYEASLRSTKSFSNHDRIIIKQTLDIMKQKQPEDKYEMVNNNTQRLLHEHLNEYEKVKIIGDIVQTIGECENCGEDFVAFTDILYKHLAPVTTTTLRSTTVSNIQQQNQQPLVIDDLYSEPVLPQTSSSTPSATRGYTKQHSEHIYAEPTMLTQQQTMMPLLLANNYSNPLDSNSNVNNNNLYSEPIMHDVAAANSTPSLGEK